MTMSPDFLPNLNECHLEVLKETKARSKILFKNEPHLI